MTKTGLVRYSRDGDQFHYLWAARRCLKLLSPKSNLVAISIEGPSPNENLDSTDEGAGEEIIDVAEYFGSQEIDQAQLIRYMQLKHSTVQATEDWTASGLEKTIVGFALRYKELLKTSSPEVLTEKLQFWFVTNRPVSNKITRTVSEASAKKKLKYPKELEKFERFTGLSGDNLAAFLKLLHFEDRQDGYWAQRNILLSDTVSYLPDADVDAPLKLKELVTRKALSENEKTPTITKIDVLRELGTDESRLYPAPCLMETVDEPITRSQEPELKRAIIEATAPIIVHASAGIGKTVFATRIANTLPEGSTCITYDCFGNGQYRCASGYRHRHKDALVQIVNELAQKGLCHPMIPSYRADSTDYVRSFSHRINQASTMIRFSAPKALLCIVIDAADNAQMAAEEIGETRSFVRDIIREKIPDNVRLIFLCRSHRQSLLDPPPETTRLELKNFTQNETALHLRQQHATATDLDIAEFHRLSSQNPRVQSLALSRNLTLPETLRLLGPNPTTVEDTIGNLLEDALVKLKDRVGSLEKKQIDTICMGLAVLRPLIPISILSKITSVQGEAISSFAIDLGRPLLVMGDTLQFFDEPVETWFREKFKPTIKVMENFIEDLKPLAKTSSYVASILPQLMLDAGKFSDLVDLALTSTALPETSPLEKRDVELQRLQFALKAALCTKRYLDATKLALKAGGVTAGEYRQRNILQENTDLAAIFLETNLVQDIVSRHTFGSGWIGSHHAYEASILSGQSELISDARSRLRMAYEWLHNLSQLSQEERKKEEISDQDIVALTLTQINVHGPDAGVHELKRWTPREVSYRVGRTVTRRLIDHGRFQEIKAFASAAGNNLCVLLAVIVELQVVHRTLQPEVVKRAFRLIANSRIKLEGQGLGSGESDLDAIIALVESALKCSICSPEEATTVLSRYLPDEPQRGLSSRFARPRFTILRAYCLRAALQGQELELRDLAYPELRDEIDKKKKYSTTNDLRNFQEDIGLLLPWHQFWAATLVGNVTKESFTDELNKVRETTRKISQNYYREEVHIINVVALIWIETIHIANAVDAASLTIFTEWKDGLKGTLFIPTLTSLARLCAHKETTKPVSLSFALDAYNLAKDERSDADSKSESYTSIARSILIVSHSEAKSYFNEAVEVASKIGDENLSRWDSLLDLAERSARTDRPSPQIAYHFARCAELTYDYVVRDKHFAWQSTIEALCGLCPASALAITSRWRDRNFGWVSQTLPITINKLIKIGSLDAHDALPLICYSANWEYEKVLDSTLSKCKTLDEKKSVTSYLYKYMRFEDGNFSKLKKVASDHGVVLDDLDSFIAHQKKKKSISHQSGDEQTYESKKIKDPSKKHWDGIFADLDPSDTNDLFRAYSSFQNSETPRHHDQFFNEAIQRVPAGSETKFIEAVTNNPKFDLYHIRNFLEQVPEQWINRPAIKKAMTASIKAICRQHCMEISINRYYERLPFKTACKLANISERDLVEIVLDSFANITDLADSDRLFSLVGLLKIKLSEDEALEALTFGLDLFNPILEENDGDGPWTDKLLPPKNVKECLAGYIWASLAAPEATLRWEGSHTVFGLAALGQNEVLGHLVQFTTVHKEESFIDATLPFYKLHAIQWFLIGIARAAIDFPSAIAPFAEQICAWGLDNQPHIFIRQLAARAALALIEHGQLSDKDGLKESLLNVNESQHPVVESNTYDRIRSRDKTLPTASGDDRYYFGIDIGPYWYKPLGEVFSLSQKEVESLALQIIRHDFCYTAKGHWDDDKRAKRKLYNDNDAMHSHGSYPRTDTLHFYHAYHAMMIVAGNLLKDMPTHRDSEYSERNEFQEWFERHDISRKDGYWLWDRRDKTPLELPSWQTRKTEADEQNTVTNEDFDELLQTQGMINIWGYWTNADETQEQTAHIRSALVPDKSHALLRALGTTNSVYDYVLPDANNQFEICKSGFELTGWITDPDSESGVDGQDRWAGGINFPPPMPASHIIDLMNLTTDPDNRSWKDKKNSIVMASQVWGHFDERNQHADTNPERGTRLQATSSFLTTMLTKLGCDLIIDVHIDCRRRSRSYTRGIDDDKERIPTKARLYLLGADGRIRTL